MRVVRLTAVLFMCLLMIASLAAADDCIKKLEGTWNFTPRNADQEQMKSDLGSVSMAFTAAPARMTITTGDEKTAFNVVTISCTANTAVVKKAGDPETLTITFSGNTIAVSSSSMKKGEAPQEFAKVN